MAHCDFQSLFKGPAKTFRATEGCSCCCNPAVRLWGCAKWFYAKENNCVLWEAWQQIYHVYTCLWVQYIITFFLGWCYPHYTNLPFLCVQASAHPLRSTVFPVPTSPPRSHYFKLRLSRLNNWPPALSTALGALANCYLCLRQ